MFVVCGLIRGDVDAAAQAVHLVSAHGVTSSSRATCRVVTSRSCHSPPNTRSPETEVVAVAARPAMSVRASGISGIIAVRRSLAAFLQYVPLSSPNLITHTNHMSVTHGHYVQPGVVIISTVVVK